MAPPIFTISSARQNFFDLFQAVTSRPGRKVIITSRGAAGHAVLVGESYLKELESAVKRLREIEAGQGMPAGSFKLVGSGRVSVEDGLAQIRLEAAAAAAEKQATLAE